MKRILFSIAVFLVFLTASTQTINQLPYFNGFEDNGVGWSANGDWELGNPNKFYLSDPNNGLKCWTTKLQGDYSNNSYSELISPVFNLSGVSNPYLSFAVEHNFDDSNDYLEIQYTTDGMSWSQLPRGTYYSGYESVWRYTNYNFEKVITTLDNISTQGTVQFKFLFISNSIGGDDGASIDDFLIGSFTSSSQNDLEAIYLGPDKGENCDGISSVAFLVQNNSLSSISRNNFTLNMRGTNGIVRTESIPDFFIAPRDYIYYEFGSSVPNGVVDAWVDYSSDINATNDTLSYVKDLPKIRDVGVQLITSPSRNLSCESNTVNVSALIANYGAATASNIPLAYRLNNGPIVRDTLNTSLSSICFNGLPYNFTFSAPITFTGDGTHKLEVWSDGYLDSDSLNDTAVSIIRYAGIKQLPFQEGFESATPAFGTSDSGSVLPVGWGTSQNTWIVRTGATPDRDKGVLKAYEGENYLYNTGLGGQITSPCIQLPLTANNIYIDLFAHSYNENFFGNDLRLFIETVDFPYSSATYYLNGAYQEAKDDPYTKFSLDLNGFNGRVVKLTFDILSSSRVTIIDQISVYESDSIDVALERVFHPFFSNSNCAPIVPEQLKVNLYNAGNNPIDSLKVCYQINSEAPVCENLEGGVLFPSQILDYTFNTELDLTEPTKAYEVKTYVTHKNDKVNLNDTVNTFFKNINLPIPYTDNLEGILNSNYQSRWSTWYGNTNYYWTLGTGSTQQFNTGPETDADGNMNGSYYYTFSGGATLGRVARLDLDNCFNAKKGNKLGVEFDYHMYGSTIGTLKLIGMTSSGLYLELDSISGQQQSSSSSPWEHRRVYIDSLPDDQIKFSFLATNGDGSQGNIAIDNFFVNDTITSLFETRLENDLKVLLVPNPSGGEVTINSNDPDFFKNKPVISVYTMDGKTIIEEFYYKKGELINLKEFGSGLYFLKIQSGDKVTFKKAQIIR